VPDKRTEPTEATAAFDGKNVEAVSWELLGDRYQLIGEIGRGGMGVVLRVLDKSFGRPLAIKVLRSDKGLSAAAERRFLDEARITGQLQHPGIPPAHEVGRLADGRPFFSMKLIEGRTLSELLTERPSPQADLPRFLKIFEQIAQTLAYAHSQGVIHRDLKPLNVMVGTFGEVQVMDWGLAKRLAHAAPVEAAPPETPQATAPSAAGPEQTVAAASDSTESHTQAGQVLGTFAYMAPEQARGEVHALRERSDVFGLGAVLCAILTGRPPYQGKGAQVLWRQAQNADLGDAWARLDVCGADPELVELARICLAPEAQDRPRDAGQVAAEMTKHLASVQERLQQTRVTQAQAEVKAIEEGKRRRLAVFLAAAVVLLVVSASAFGLWYANDQARRDRDQATQDGETAARTEHLHREVAAALDEATRWRDDLHARLRDPRKAAGLLSELHQWQTLLESAQAAWKRADALAGGRDLLAPELQERVARVAKQLQTDEEERQLAFALDKIQLEASGLVNGQINLVSATPKLARLFHDAGYRVEDDRPAETAARLRQSTIRLPLVAGLDFWALTTHDRPLQARLLEAARLADPHPWRDRFRQAEVWYDPGKLKALAHEVDFNEQSPQVLTALAHRLYLGGDLEFVRRALVAHPRDFWLMFHLGMNSSNAVEQAGAFRAALAVRPQAPVVYYNLGYVQQCQKKLAEAEACYRKAVELNPNYGGAYNNLGLVLDDLGKPDQARECYLKATQLEPRAVLGHLNLGGSLHALGKFDEAIESYRKASAIEPKNAPVLNNLATALRAKNQLDDAVECYRKALDLDDTNAFAWCNLGHTLNVLGKFDEALKAMRRGHELGSKQPGWDFPSALWVKETENWVALDQKLSAVLSGKATPADAREQAAMAQLCIKARKRYAAATRFYAAAFAAEPNLAANLFAGHRYNAASAAVLAAAGKGIDADQLKDPPAARRQALEWLRADLQARTELLKRQPTQNTAIAGLLQQWQTDPHLASVRDAAALAKFPPDEQSAWQQFWADVAALHQRAGARPAHIKLDSGIGLR
jgi:tetratricopeptide (TPR) repeat protein